MDLNIGLTGIVAVGNTGVTVGASGKPIRVFDIILSDTAGTITLRNGTTIASELIITLPMGDTYDMHSNAGIRFTNGCFASATGSTAHVNYITEF
jgi:hypothetical protein